MTKQQIGAAARKARGTRSIRSVARDAGITQGQVKGIEEASKAYTVDTLLALGKVIGLRLQFLPAKGSGAALTKGVDGPEDVRG